MNRRFPASTFVSERLLQCLWQDQSFDPQRFRSVHNQRIAILEPGVWNCDAGPDFVHALIQVEDAPPIMGDVEIHLRPTGWFQHRHHLDRLYRRVILHVALEDDGQLPIYHLANNANAITQAALRPALRQDIQDLAQTIDLWAYPFGHPRTVRPCRNVLNEMSPLDRQAFLEAAGMERFEKKIQRLALWIGVCGWPEAVLRALFDTLGYRDNRGCMRALFDRRFHLAFDHPLTEEEEIAVHLGIAGLLPRSLPHPADAAACARRYHQICWRLEILPAEPHLNWCRHNVRPANSPHRRVVAAALLYHDFERLWDHARQELLESALRPPVHTPAPPSIRDPFWDHRSGWDTAPSDRPTALIGAPRWLEILGNVLLPAAALHSDITEEAALGYAARRCFQALPPAATNRRLKEAITRLLPQTRQPPSTQRLPFIQQQGLLEIFMETCLQARAPCSDCRLNRLIEQWYGPDPD